MIAPFVKRKDEDPPVIVIDPSGQAVIPILSGHVGGANDLSVRLASYLGARAVLTTATDCLHAFAADNFAKDHHMAVSDAGKAKEISAKAVAGETIRIFADPGEEFPDDPSVIRVPDPGNADVVISIRSRKTRALQLFPRRVIAGIGCRKGEGKEEIIKALEAVLARAGIALPSVCAIASIDLKKDEEGLRGAASDLRVPFVTFSGESLSLVDGSSASSDFVQKVTGVDNVCERACLSMGFPLLVPKEVFSHVTVAAARSFAKILLFGGTTEGHELARYFEKRKIPALVLVATPEGKVVLKDLRGCRVLTGRLTEDEMEAIFTALRPRLVIDATHPYAALVSANIKVAARRCGIRTVRVMREKTEKIPGAAYFESAADAAAFLSRTAGNILLTTGSKDLSFYAGIRDHRDRVYARVLPCSRDAAMAAGLPESHVLSGDGPFFVEDNIAAIRDTDAAFLVTKDSGEAGGLLQKVQAAERTGAALLIIERPAEDTKGERVMSLKDCEEMFDAW